MPCAYEEPENPEIIVDSENNSIDECVDMIIEYLDKVGALCCDISEQSESKLYQKFNHELS